MQHLVDRHAIDPGGARGGRDVAIVLREQAPRYVARAETVGIEGFDIPVILLWPDSPVLAQRVEWALRLHGLT